jgi:hypothetical protein
VGYLNGLETTVGSANGSSITREGGEGITGQFYVAVTSYYPEGQVAVTTKYFTVVANPEVGLEADFVGVACGQGTLIPSGAVSYDLYTGDNGFDDILISSGAGNFQINAPGNYFVIGTDENGCISRNLPALNVALEKTPTFGPKFYYAGAWQPTTNEINTCLDLVSIQWEAIDLYAGIESYSWNNGTLTTASITASPGQSYDCIITSVNGCNWPQNTLTVTKTELKKPKLEYDTLTNILSYKTKLQLSTIEWLKGSKIIADANDSTFYPTKDGKYSVRVKTTTNCIVESNQMKITLVSGKQVTSLEDYETSALKIYPNPAIDLINISDQDNPDDQVYIYDLTGKLLIISHQGEINISKVPTGTCIAVVGEKREKVIIQH